MRALQFRSVERGGLGLIEPFIKSRAFLLRGMLKDVKPGVSVQDLGTGKNEGTVRELYGVLLEQVVSKNGSLIPSREEKRCNIRWKAAWKNMNLLKEITPEEKMFAWKLCQDLLTVGARIHKKRCMENWEGVF